MGVVRLVGKPVHHKRTATDAILQEYSEYLIKERCISAGTRGWYLRLAEQFLTERLECKHKLNSLRAADLSAFVLEQFKNWSVRKCQYAVTALRSLLHYLFMRGRIPVDLSTAVPGVAGWRLSSSAEGAFTRGNSATA